MTEELPHNEQTFVEPSRTGEGIVRSMRVPIQAWDKAKQVAENDGINLSIALNRFLIGYASNKIDLPEPRHFDGPNLARKFRCSDRTWNRAESKAQEAGHTIGEVVNRFVAAYATGLELPQLALIYPE